jgi:DNA-binding transcriptional LysR family regulator
MVQEGLDLAIRIAPVTDPTLVARRVGSTTMVTVASPAYLAERGTPARPQDLTEHDCVIFTRLQTPELWRLTNADGTEEVGVRGRLHANSIECILQATLAGAGIALLPSWLLGEQLASGALEPVLTAWQPGRRAISVVYPSRRFLAPRTRAVIDFLVDEFRLDPAISAYGES